MKNNKTSSFYIEWSTAKIEDHLTEYFQTPYERQIWHKVVNCPKDWSGDIIFQLNNIFLKIKGK